MDIPTPLSHSLPLRTFSLAGSLSEILPSIFSGLPVALITRFCTVPPGLTSSESTFYISVAYMNDRRPTPFFADTHTAQGSSLSYSARLTAGGGRSGYGIARKLMTVT